MHAIHNQRSLLYISDTVQTVAIATARCRLRLSATTDYLVPITFSKFGERAFAYAAWNRLPDDICRQCKLQKTLKTFLFAKSLTLPSILNIVMSAGHPCKWTQSRRWWWWMIIMVLKRFIQLVQSTMKNLLTLHNWSMLLRAINSQDVMLSLGNILQLCKVRSFCIINNNNGTSLWQTIAAYACRTVTDEGDKNLLDPRGLRNASPLLQI